MSPRVFCVSACLPENLVLSTFDDIHSLVDTITHLPLISELMLLLALYNFDRILSLKVVCLVAPSSNLY